jgi:hypothetical protein
MPRKKAALAFEPVIRTIRDQRVILDQDLAVLYGVPNKVLLQAVKRNANRFPKDFVFRLGNEEFSGLRSQIVTSNGRGGRRYLPLAFTAEGVAMLSGVLHSDRAVNANIAIMREFVRLRTIAALRDTISKKLDVLERRVDGHDQDLDKTFEAIQQMMAETQKQKPKIGFGRDHETALKTKKITA